MYQGCVEGDFGIWESSPPEFQGRTSWLKPRLPSRPLLAAIPPPAVLGAEASRAVVFDRAEDVRRAQLTGVAWRACCRTWVTGQPVENPFRTKPNKGKLDKMSTQKKSRQNLPCKVCSEGHSLQNDIGPMAVIPGPSAVTSRSLQHFLHVLHFANTILHRFLISLQWETGARETAPLPQHEK